MQGRSCECGACLAVYDCCNRPITFQAAVVNPCVSSMECLYDHCIACLQVLNATVPPQPAYPAPREPVPLLDVAAANGEVAPEIGFGEVMSERGPAEHVKVSTPKELVQAVLGGKPHIVITAHLDLTTLPLITNEICPDGCSSPLPEILRAESIRVLLCLSHPIAR